MVLCSKVAANVTNLSPFGFQLILCGKWKFIKFDGYNFSGKNCIAPDLKKNNYWKEKRKEEEKESKVDIIFPLKLVFFFIMKKDD